MLTFQPPDYAVWSISRSPVSLILLASSPVTFTFLLRPFSNSLETVLLAVAFLLLGRPTQWISVSLGRTRLGLIGAVLALGVWTRITFAAFAAPLVVAVALQAGQITSCEPRFRYVDVSLCIWPLR